MFYDFVKMQGAGNDYIYIDSFGEKELPCDIPALAVKLSRRRFSIGADGIITIEPSEICDAKMRIFNADGSEGNMCGNGIRCVGKYLYDRRITTKTDLLIETKSGPRAIHLNVTDGKVTTVRVDMGIPCFEPQSIPVSWSTWENVLLSNGATVDCVSVGNPHAVCLVEDPSSLDLEKIGPSYENDPLFPERINTEFVSVVNPYEINFRVYERGSAETLACGTGAVAAVAVLTKKGLLGRDRPVTVNLRGGRLSVEYSTDGHLYKTGPAETVCEGRFEI